MLAKGLAGPLRPKQEEYAQIISGSGNHLLEIINDILDLAKIDAGKVDLNEEEIDPTCIVNACFRIVRENAGSGGLHLSMESEGPIPVLLADPRRLKQDSPQPRLQRHQIRRAWRLCHCGHLPRR